MNLCLPDRALVRHRAFLFLAFLGLVLGPGARLLFAQTDDPVRVLIVTAHPDDEAMFAASVYQITHALGGKVDLALITDGSGGFTYATLAESLYDLPLTDEEIARQYLPAIRKKELMAGGKIVGIRNYFFLDQLDAYYTLNVDSVLQHVWDTDLIRARLRAIMAKGAYDFVLTHLPIAQTHGHHKGATIMALETAYALATPPIVLGSFISSKSDSTTRSFPGVPGYPLSQVLDDGAPFTFDRTRSFGPNDRLNYKIVVNWLIAEHKSQGTMQLLVNRGDIENFWIFDLGNPDAVPKTRALFDQLDATSLERQPDESGGS